MNNRKWPFHTKDAPLGYFNVLFPNAEQLYPKEKIVGEIGGIFLTDYAIYINKNKLFGEAEKVRIEYNDIVMVEKNQNKVRVGGFSADYEMNYAITFNSHYQFETRWPINDGILNKDDIWKYNLQTMDSFFELLQNIVKENSSVKHQKMAENIKKHVSRTDENLKLIFNIF